ncbi:histone-arginine methyltransferase CARM1-like [Menidia menidia]
MEELDEESFSVRVFTLQEEAHEEMEVRTGQHVSVCSQEDGQQLTLVLQPGLEAQQLTVQDASRASVFQLPLSEEMDGCQVGAQSFLVTVGALSLLLQFKTPNDLKRFQEMLRKTNGGTNQRGQSTRGQPGSRSPPIVCGSDPEVSGCHQFHGCLGHQQILLQDYQRNATYQRAILANEDDFRDKVVLDVCCGSGILSFFAVQAGASRVYAVETSPMAKYTQGLMFPSCADLHMAPFTDEQLYYEHHARASFWQQSSFYRVNLSALHGSALDEFFRQPVVDAFDVQILMARSVKHCINFKEATEEEIHRVEIPFVFTLLQSGLVHGLAFWFDVAYLGSKTTVWFSTAPSEPLTRWSQVRCLLQTPLFAKLGQTLSGNVLLVNDKSRQSHDIQITATVDQSGFSSGNILDLKNPFFRTHDI